MGVTLFDSMTDRNAEWLGPMETSFDFLNGSSRPVDSRVRRRLESWFRRYPTANNEHLALRARFRSDTSDHTAAFFELYCYTLLRRHRFAIKVEPSLSGVPTVIDFLACRGQKRVKSLRLEAKVVCDSDTEVSIQRNLILLRASLNTLNSPTFRFSIAVLQGSRTPLPMKAIRRDVREWLASLDPVAFAASQVPLERRLSRQYDKWELAFVPHIRPQVEYAHENVSAVSLGGWKGNHDRIREKLEDKASKYDTLLMPFVIAIDVLSTRDLISGTAATLMSTEANTSFWATHPQVSAVLAVTELLPWSCVRQAPVLWHNPHATYPLDRNLWKATQNVWDSTNTQWKMVRGKPVYELLDMAAAWPQ